MTDKNGDKIVFTKFDWFGIILVLSACMVGTYLAFLDLLSTSASVLIKELLGYASKK